MAPVTASAAETGEAVGAFTSSMGPRVVTAEEGDGCEMFTSSM